MSGIFNFTNSDSFRNACAAGSDLIVTFEYSDECTGVIRDLTGYSARMQVRSSITSSVKLLDIWDRRVDKVVAPTIVPTTVYNLTINATTHIYTAQIGDSKTAVLTALAAQFSIGGVTLSVASETLTITGTQTAASSTNLTVTNPTIDGFVVDGAAGRITLSIPASFTSLLATGMYVYDIELTSDEGVVERTLEGKFQVTGEVTRED